MRRLLSTVRRRVHPVTLTPHSVEKLVLDGQIETQGALQLIFEKECKAKVGEVEVRFQRPWRR